MITIFLLYRRKKKLVSFHIKINGTEEFLRVLIFPYQTMIFSHQMMFGE